MYRTYHFLPAVLAQPTGSGSDFTFQVPAGGLLAATQGSSPGTSLGQLSTADLLAGERVSVSYATAASGALVANSIAVISGGPVPAPPADPTSTSATPPPSTPTPAAPVVSPAPDVSGGAGYDSGGAVVTGGAPLGE